MQIHWLCFWLFSFVIGTDKLFSQAVKCLEECHLQNSEEEVEQQKMLLHLYINSAICQLRLNHHVRVLSYCHQALDIQEQNVKAFFLKGKVTSVANTNILLLTLVVL